MIIRSDYVEVDPKDIINSYLKYDNTIPRTKKSPVHIVVVIKHYFSNIIIMIWHYCIYV